MAERIFEGFLNELRGCFDAAGVFAERKGREILRAYRRDGRLAGLSDGVYAAVLRDLAEEWIDLHAAQPQIPADVPQWDDTALLSWASQAGWTPGGGEVIGHFRDKPPGHRCLWTCRWNVGGRQFGPVYFVDLETAPEMYLKLELQDHYDRTSTSASREMLERWPGRETVGRFLNERRTGYPEYLWPWQPTFETLKLEIWRPGWPKAPWARG